MNNYICHIKIVKKLLVLGFYLNDSRNIVSNIFLVFLAARIDGELFPTLTRDEFCDMFKNLRQKRAAIAVWTKLSGMVLTPFIYKFTSVKKFSVCYLKVVYHVV